MTDPRIDPHINYRHVFKAIDPSRTLDVAKPEDDACYIDFTPVRGDKVIRKLKNRIVNLSPDEPTCSLFTGHIGCGKSTELKRLRKELRDEKFFVVYFESDEDVDMLDVDIVDILMTIAKRISAELENFDAPPANNLRRFVNKVHDILFTEIDLKLSAGIEGAKGELDTKKKSASLSTAIGKIVVAAKDNSTIRSKLNNHVGPQLTALLDEINTDLIAPGIAFLRQRGYRGLVTIIDNLDRIDKRAKASGRSQQEYIFVDRGSILTKLACHTIYTMPLSLMFSSEYGNLTQRFPHAPERLPMVRIAMREGGENASGLEKLKQMVLARIFPMSNETERRSRVGEIFAEVETFDRLCRLSGGHVRGLLKLMLQWIEEEMQLPLTADSLEGAVREQCDNETCSVSDAEWELLARVRETQEVSDDEGYEKLIRSRIVFEYRDKRGSWYAVNPILLEAGKLS
ncbi:MAG: P-loop NTPase fold protein [Geitlerinemataceae cyanobacterium]